MNPEPWIPFIGQIKPFAHLIARAGRHRLALAEYECEAAARQAVSLFGSLLMFLVVFQISIFSAFAAWLVFLLSRPDPAPWLISGLIVSVAATLTTFLSMRRRLGRSQWFVHLREQLAKDADLASQTLGSK